MQRQNALRILSPLMAGVAAAVLVLAATVFMAGFTPESGKGRPKPPNPVPDPSNRNPGEVAPLPMTPEIRKIVDNYMVEARKNHDSGKLGEAIRNGEFALKFLRDRGLLLEAAERLLELAGWYAESGDLSRATHYYLAVYVQGEERAGSKPEWESLSRQALAEHRNFVFKLSNEGRDEEAVRSLEILLAEFRRRGLKAAEAQGLHNLAWVMSDNGLHDKAIETYARALAIWRKTGDRTGEVWTLNNMGFARLQSGNLSGALDPLLQALGLAEEGFPEAWIKVVDNLLLTAQKAGTRGEYDTALLATERLVPSAKNDGRWYLVNRVLFARAVALRGAGRFDEARAVLDELIAVNRAEKDAYSAASYAVETGKILAVQGRTEDALEVLTGAIKELRDMGSLLGASWAYDAGARALQDKGQHHRAVEWFRKAVEGFESAEENRYGLLAVLPALARSLGEIGLEEEAKATLEKSRKLEGTIDPADLEQAFFMEDLERRAHVLASMKPGEMAVLIRRDGEGWHFTDLPTGRRLDLPMRYLGRHVVFQGSDFRIEGPMIAHGGFWVFLAEGQEAGLTREGKFLRKK